MNGVLFVALGGAAGAVCRYLISEIPFPYGKLDFPFWTLIINFIGAFVIGIIAGSSALGSNAMLFWKVGVCGGFTTFSTFSLETFNLFNGGRVGAGVIYIALSVILCLAGVLLGKLLSTALAR